MVILVGCMCGRTQALFVLRYFFVFFVGQCCWANWRCWHKFQGVNFIFMLGFYWYLTVFEQWKYIISSRVISPDGTWYPNSEPKVCEICQRCTGRSIPPCLIECERNKWHIYELIFGSNQMFFSIDWNYFCWHDMETILVNSTHSFSCPPRLLHPTSSGNCNPARAALRLVNSLGLNFSSAPMSNLCNRARSIKSCLRM